MPTFPAKRPIRRRQDRRLVALREARASDSITTAPHHDGAAINTPSLLHFLKHLLNEVADAKGDMERMREIRLQLDICKEMRHLVRQQTIEQFDPPPTQIVSDVQLDTPDAPISIADLRAIREVIDVGPEDDPSA